MLSNFRLLQPIRAPNILCIYRVYIRAAELNQVENIVDIGFVIE
jgi:hypothetical protein